MIIRLFFSDKSILLLKGSSGSGKSILLKNIELVIWKHFESHSANGESVSNSSDNPPLIPIYCSLGALSKPLTELVPETLKSNYGFSDPAVNEFKAAAQAGLYKILLLLDGYDEIKNDFKYRNLYDENDLEEWGPLPTADNGTKIYPKCIISCRTQFIESQKSYEDFFYPIISYEPANYSPEKWLDICEIEMLNDMQIKEYLDASYLKAIKREYLTKRSVSGFNNEDLISAIRTVFVGNFLNEAVNTEVDDKSIRKSEENKTKSNNEIIVSVAAVNGDDASSSDDTRGSYYEEPWIHRIDDNLPKSVESSHTSNYIDQRVINSDLNGRDVLVHDREIMTDTNESPAVVPGCSQLLKIEPIINLLTSHKEYIADAIGWHPKRLFETITKVLKHMKFTPFLLNSFIKTLIRLSITTETEIKDCFEANVKAEFFGSALSKESEYFWAYLKRVIINKKFPEFDELELEKYALNFLNLLGDESIKYALSDTTTNENEASSIDDDVESQIADTKSVLKKICKKVLGVQPIIYYDLFDELTLFHIDKQVELYYSSGYGRTSVSRDDLAADIFTFSRSLAFEMTLKRVSRVNYNQVGTILTATSALAVWSEYFKPPDPYHKLLRDLSPIQSNGSVYSFIHKSIQEYLVANRYFTRFTESPCLQQTELIEQIVKAPVTVINRTDGKMITEGILHINAGEYGTLYKLDKAAIIKILNNCTELSQSSQAVIDNDDLITEFINEFDMMLKSMFNSRICEEALMSEPAILDRFLVEKLLSHPTYMISLINICKLSQLNSQKVDEGTERMEMCINSKSISAAKLVTLSCLQTYIFECELLHDTKIVDDLVDFTLPRTIADFSDVLNLDGWPVVAEEFKTIRKSSLSTLDHRLNVMEYFTKSNAFLLGYEIYSHSLIINRLHVNDKSVKCLYSLIKLFAVKSADKRKLIAFAFTSYAYFFTEVFFYNPCMKFKGKLKLLIDSIPDISNINVKVDPIVDSKDLNDESKLIDVLNHNDMLEKYLESLFGDHGCKTILKGNDKTKVFEYLTSMFCDIIVHTYRFHKLFSIDNNLRTEFGEALRPIHREDIDIFNFGIKYFPAYGKIVDGIVPGFDEKFSVIYKLMQGISSISNPVLPVES